MRIPSLAENSMRLLAIISIIAAITTAGCASPSQRRAAGPMAEYSSSKSVNDVAICISRAWADLPLAGSVDVNMTPIPGGVSLKIAREEVFVDIVSQGAGSKSSYYRIALFVGGGRVQRPVEVCQG